MIRVYIAGPYSANQRQRRQHHVDRANVLAADLIRQGFNPLVPHNSHYIDELAPDPIDYEQWMTLDFHWIEVCDCLLRMEGASTGADREAEFAEKIGIPVFYTVTDLLAWRDIRDLKSDKLKDEAFRAQWRDIYAPRIERLSKGGLPHYSADRLTTVRKEARGETLTAEERERLRKRIRVDVTLPAGHTRTQWGIENLDRLLKGFFAEDLALSVHNEIGFGGR